MPQDPMIPTSIEDPAIPPPARERILALHAEEIEITKRTVSQATVRVSKVTRTHDQTLHETLSHQRVDVERVPIGTYVDVAPPVRQEGDMTILSVVEEVLVTERRLLLKEEVRIRRIQMPEEHVETIPVRVEEAVVERIPARG